VLSLLGSTVPCCLTCVRLTFYALVRGGVIVRATEKGRRAWIDGAMLAPCRSLCWRVVWHTVILCGFHPLHYVVDFRNVASFLYVYCSLESLLCFEDVKRALLFQDS
jgi:hypothetical protein